MPVTKEEAPIKNVGVISNPRSGTSLLTHMLVASFDIAALKASTGPNTLLRSYRVGIPDIEAAGDERHFLLHIIRDPRDVITSRHPSSPDKYLITFDSWLENHNKILSFDDRINILKVRFEDLVTNPEMVQHKIADFLTAKVLVPLRDAHKHFHELPDREDMDIEMGGDRPLDPSRVGRWKETEYKQRIVEQMCPELLDMLVELGYEENNDWAEDYD